MKKVIKITESELNKIVQRVISEGKKMNLHYFMDKIGDFGSNLRYSDKYKSFTSEKLEKEISKIMVLIDKAINQYKDGNLTKAELNKIKEYGEEIISGLEDLNESESTKKAIREDDGKTLLRTKTMRSPVGDEAEMYKGWTVEKLLNHDPKKIYYIYTHFEKINYTDEVLDALREKNIPVEKIQKPGTDKDQYDAYIDERKAKFVAKMEEKTLDELIKYIGARKANKLNVPAIVYQILKNKKAEKISGLNLDKYVESKYSLSRKNHGHKKFDD